MLGSFLHWRLGVHDTYISALYVSRPHSHFGFFEWSDFKSSYELIHFSIKLRCSNCASVRSVRVLIYNNLLIRLFPFALERTMSFSLQSATSCMKTISHHKGWEPFLADPRTDGISILSLLILTIPLPLQWNRKPCPFEVSENSPFEPLECHTFICEIKKPIITEFLFSG